MNQFLINKYYYIIALDEARDISTHLKPLQKHLDELEQIEFPEVKKFISPIFHVIGLIWGNSTHYRRPGRIIVLLQELGNLLIELVSVEPYKPIAISSSFCTCSLKLQQVTCCIALKDKQFLCGTLSFLQRDMCSHTCSEPEEIL